MTALSRLLDARAEELKLSNRRISELSEQCPNGTISQGAAGQYRRGRHPAMPSDRILRVLSWVLGIPLPSLQRAAGVPESREDWVPPPEAHQMTRAHREIVETLIKMLVGAPPAEEETAEAGVWSMDIPDDTAEEGPCDAANGHTPGQGNGD